jgi:DNA-binding FadR family transcriptional regulator
VSAVIAGDPEAAAKAMLDHIIGATEALVELEKANRKRRARSRLAWVRITIRE